MTNKDLTHIEMVLDRSGSMSSCKSDTEGGFNTFIAEQKKVPGECRVTLAQFDNTYEVVYADRPLAEVPDLALAPRGGTALLDAIGRSINSLGKRLNDTPEEERPGAVVFVILTDGQENSSVEFSLTRIHEMISHQRDTYGWQFMFIGANQDAIQAGASLGIARGMSITYDQRVGTQAVFASTASNVANYRGMVAKGAPVAAAATAMSYTDAQRTAAVTGIDVEEEQN